MSQFIKDINILIFIIIIIIVVVIVVVDNMESMMQNQKSVLTQSVGSVS